MQRTLPSVLPFAAPLIGFLLFTFPHGVSAALITISMTDNQFTPKTATIQAGDTVTWVNNGAIAHTASADNGTFDSGSLQPGQSFTAIFNSIGTYAYYSKLQGGVGGQGMAGIISVVAQPSGSTVVTTSVPVPNNAGLVAELQAKLQTLLNQISVLQGQGGSGTASAVPAGTVSYDASSCPLIGRSLHIGSSGDDVTRLQQFLARDADVYPQGQVSGYYGPLTEAAVQRWQVKYHIVSSGTAATTGYGVVGPRTAAAISILCTTGSYAGVSGPSGSSGSPVGGYITVTPIGGPAPLTVHITATVNTTHSCTPTTYVLDFGDGTVPQQIVLSGGACGESSQTFTHVYPYAGTFLVRLSAEGHATTATVVVSGLNSSTQLACPSGFHAALVGGAYKCIQDTGTPSNPSYSYSPPTVTTSSTDPLSFTLRFDLPSSCTGFDVDWGDGSQHSTQSDGGSSCSLSQSSKSLTHTYPSASTYVLTVRRGESLTRQDDISITVQL